MKNIFRFTLGTMLLMVIPKIYAQDPIVKPDTGQSSYIIASGESQTLESSSNILLKPGVHIQSGATFFARITDAPIILPQLADYTAVTVDDDRNYVLQRVYQEYLDSFDQVVKEQEIIETLTYIDGLGRPEQSLGLKASHDYKDLVTPIVYDDFGRQEKIYLPYPALGTSGSYRSTAINSINSYYTTNYADDLSNNSPNPFSQMQYEPSPLNKVLKQAAPGEDWKIGSNHEIEFTYETNESNTVRRYEVTFNNGNTELPLLDTNYGFYNEGQLLKNTIKDENWISGNNHTTQEFTNKQGQVILKRTFSDEIPHDTYYVYDDFGNLTFVIPPKVNTADGVSTTELSELCYQYKYDQRNRLIEKKIPGKKWEYIVYDKLDRPVLTQDANLKATNEWLFTKYDPFGRVAYSGAFPSTSSRADRQGFQDNVTTPYEIAVTLPTTIDNIGVYYSNSVLPTHNLELHTINYYDNYSLARDGIAKPLGLIFDQAITNHVQGLPTVTKVRVLDTDNWITTLTAYDNKGRAIYINTINEYLNSEDIVEIELDFAGKVLKTRTTHIKDDNAPIITLDTFSYDHAARLLTHHQQLGGNIELIASNTYDGIGQLVKKDVGNTLSTPLQSVDYAYNVRGWLKGINDQDQTDNTLTITSSDLFGFKIDYNDPANGTPLYNGNISRTQWRSQNQDKNPRHYDYSYDALNRLTSAIDGTGDQRYSLPSISYDKNGNILTLDRKGHRNTGLTSFGFMDNLSYAYDAGNKLLRVTDGISGTAAEGGFNDGNKTGDDYDYDLNGNMTLDKNKGITRIEYNHLNLPTQIVVNGNGNIGIIDYIYAADGTKIQKIASDTGEGSLTATDYCGNYIYEKIGSNTTELKFFSHPEGYIEPNGNGSYDYVYQYKDHLGNIRLSYSDDNNDGLVTTSEIREENNYYPFGLKHKGYNNNQNGRDHKFEYNGMELEESLGINMMEMDMRQFDAAIGRWVVIDPITHHSMSTYNGFDNNPVFWADPSGGSVTRGEDGAVTIDGDDAAQAFINLRNAFNDGTGPGDKDKKKKKKKSQKKAVRDMSTGELYGMAYNGSAMTAFKRGGDPYNPTEADIAKSEEESAEAAGELALFIGGEWLMAKLFQGAAGLIWGTRAIKVLDKTERLNKFRSALSKAKTPKNADEAIQLINRELDAVEDLYSGIRKNPNAASMNRSDGRMYGVLDDTFVTRHSNGNITALTKGHRIEANSNGSFNIFVRKTGKLFFSK